MAKTFYLNLFHNSFLKYSGFKKELKPAENSTGKRPVMVPINSLRKAVKFPYALDEKKNIKKFSSGGIEVAFLCPTRNVANLTDTQYEDSLYYKLVGDTSSDAEELREKLDKKEKKIGLLKKEKRELEEEEEERNKGSSSRSNGSSLRCPSCGSSNAESRWDNNMGLCPTCDGVDKSNLEVQRV